MNFEKRPIPASSLEAERRQREGIREQIFQQLVASKLLEHFHDELDEAEIPSESLTEITDTFATLPEPDKRTVLAIPAQLRPALFRKYADDISQGKITGAGVVEDILQKGRKYGFTIGYHLSPRDIKPEKDGSWIIKGTEPDHRHDDLPMAYYSLDYAHRYLKKPSQFLYVVRGETGANSTHHRDNDESWGHASSLSIVDKIDLKDLEAEMDAHFAALEKGKSKEGAAA